MDAEFIQTLLVTGKLAFFTTLFLLIMGMPLACWLAFYDFRIKPLIEAFISMPMVLPPTVLGFYMLSLYSPDNWPGRFLIEHFDTRLAFSFEGLVIASVVFGLPFMVQPLQNGLSALSPSLRQASYTLGKSKTTTFFKVVLPNIRPSVITAVAMTFAHCIGEFGVVMMVGGNMPGETRVASIAIYDEVQALNFGEANKYSLILFLFSLFILTIIFSINGKKRFKH
jgi:molybdate transport system permease protein